MSRFLLNLSESLAVWCLLPVLLLGFYAVAWSLDVAHALRLTTWPD